MSLIIIRIIISCVCLCVYVCVRDVVGPSTMGELNAANVAVDSALAATNNLTSRLDVVNATISSIANISAYEDHDLQISQLNDSCAYCSGSLKPYLVITC